MGENDASGGFLWGLELDEPIHAELAAAAEPLFPAGNPHHREKTSPLILIGNLKCIDLAQRRAMTCCML